jgi:hypothetical protein
MKEEFELLGVPFEDRGRLMDEYLAAFKELRTKDKPSYGVTTINNLRLRGENGEQAIVEGALIRLRPGLDDRLVDALGFVPMANATGTGAEVQKPLATVVIGGLMTATLLTLVVLPALYKRSALTDATLRDVRIAASWPFKRP